ncbi:hypothetical protein [Chryseosolibacter indicus]|uniref:Uncharacterized protein n=1 Tax=Chryseosolibacter indicus TaxID=2782351 RepID=A0ABS5VP79_9BACT|nr:hypothetical protein [Chryseosolibacter indicus]MBT1702956.1 hypothetical protein [Chryseosolibacter indicus]
MEKVNHYFKTYTESNECFETSDEFLFHREDDAKAHAATLRDKDVKAYTRAEVTGWGASAAERALNLRDTLQKMVNENAEKLKEQEEAEAKAEAEQKAQEEAEALAKSEAEQKAKEEAEAKHNAESEKQKEEVKEVVQEVVLEAIASAEVVTAPETKKKSKKA